MGFDLGAMGEAFGGSGRTFSRCLPVRVDRFELGEQRQYCVGRVMGSDGSFQDGDEAKVWLGPTDKAGRRTLQELSRKVKPGGVIRFDKVRQEEDGSVSAHWPVVLSHKPGEYEVAVEWMRVVPVRKDSKIDKLYLEVVFPARRALPTTMAELEQVLTEQAFGAAIPGVPRAVLRISSGQAREAQMLSPKFSDTGAPMPAAESTRAFMASKAAKFVQAAFDASALVEIIPATTSILMGQETQARQEKAGMLPDRWFKMADGEQGYAKAVASLGKRANGSWMFIEAKPLVVPVDLVGWRDLPVE